MRRARAGIVVALAVALVSAVTGPSTAATTAKTPSAAIRACATSKGFQVGATDAVITPTAPATVTVWACLDKAPPAGASVSIWGAQEDGGAHGRFSLSLHRSAESSRVYWATWTVSSNVATGSYLADGAVFVHDVAVEDAETSFAVLRQSAVRLDVGPEPAYHGGNVTVAVGLKKFYPPSGASLVPYPGQRVRITFDPTGSRPATLVRTVTTDASGRATFTAPVSASGVWRASFAGTPDKYDASSASDSVSVIPLRSVLTTTATSSRTSAGASLTMRGTLRHATSYAMPAYVATPGKTLTVTFDPTGSAAPRKVGTVTTGKDGTFTYHGAVTGSGTLTVAFPGSATYSSRSAQVAVRVG